jgi:DNA repair protein RecO (recombination protein O)
MNWIDEGYLISKNNYNETSIIADIFTKEHGKCSGIIFGGTSKKIRNYLQIGNKLHINYNYKNEGKTGYFKVEILKANTPLFFDDKKKLMCISSAMSLVKLLTVEFQKNWLKHYIFWELNLLKFLGYDLNLENIVTSENINNQLKYTVKSSSAVKQVPNFLVDKNEEDINFDTLLLGLKLVTDYLQKSILIPNNISQPHSRINFINILK